MFQKMWNYLTDKSLFSCFAHYYYLLRYLLEFTKTFYPSEIWLYSTSHPSAILEMENDFIIF